RASRMRDTFGVDVSLRALFEAPTVAGFASRLEASLRENAGVATPPLVPVSRDPENGDLPLSFAQERLWFIDQLQPDDSAYVMPLAVRLDGPVDLAALAGALTAVVARHEALRTSFPVIAGQARQEIAPPEQMSIPLIDLSALPAAEREAAAAHLTAEEARRLVDGPPGRRVGGPLRPARGGRRLAGAARPAGAVRRLCRLAAELAPGRSA